MNYKTGQVYKINLKDGNTVTGRLERIFKENKQWFGYMEGISHTVQLDELQKPGIIEQESYLVPDAKERLESIVYMSVQRQANHWAAYAAKKIVDKLENWNGMINEEAAEDFDRMVDEIKEEYNLDK